MNSDSARTANLVTAMKPRHSPPPALRRLAAAAAGLLALAAPARAQTVEFDSGSTGALGDVVITNDTTIVLPADGVLHYQSFTVKNGAAVRFIKNAHNTPVYLLSQGDVVIEGRIFVPGTGSAGQFGPGLGGPGGFDGGGRGAGTMPPGDGQGPGGGRAGLESGPTSANSAGPGAFLQIWGAGTTNYGAVYGNAALIPLIGGSGGGGTINAGGGVAAAPSSSPRTRAFPCPTPTTTSLTPPGANGVPRAPGTAAAAAPSSWSLRASL